MANLAKPPRDIDSLTLREVQKLMEQNQLVVNPRLMQDAEQWAKQLQSMLQAIQMQVRWLEQLPSSSALD